MTALVPVLAAVAAAAAAGLLCGRSRRRGGTACPPVFLWVSVVLPFAAGGFHTYVSAATAVVLTADLIRCARKNNGLIFCRNLSSAALVLLTAGYCVSFLWAADRGMAVFAVVRYLPVLLYALVLMQYSPEERAAGLGLLPVSGAVMTAVSCLLLLVPGMESYVTVNGRLSGFLQYPNAFAAFQLAGLILNHTGSSRRKYDAAVDALLILGTVLSGSRTSFVLLGVTLAGILLLPGQRRQFPRLAGALTAGLVLALGAARLGLLPNADRFTSISAASGTFLVRLLYYKDALPVILKHPFGTGYLGYRALEATFQTGRYNVSFVHNGFLQILLDIGWAPAIVLAAALLGRLFSRRTPPGDRLLLAVLLCRCMLDFDLQFFLFWGILIAVMDLDRGHILCIPRKRMDAGTAALVTALCIWLGTGDLLYQLGRTKACLAVTPFHTDALTGELMKLREPDSLDAAADRILQLNPTHSLAASAKANAAFSRGRIADMIRYKELAIRLSPYTTAEYCDYFEKLYTAMEMYLQAGQTDSAYYCGEKLCGIPEMMEETARRTDPLAYRTGDDMTLSLPEEYQELLRQIGPAGIE